MRRSAIRGKSTVTDKLREILDIRLVNIENIDSELTEDDEVILVDAQKGNSNIIDMTGD